MTILKGAVIIVALLFTMVVALPPLSEGITAIASGLGGNPETQGMLRLVPIFLFLGLIILISFVVFRIWPRSRA